MVTLGERLRDERKKLQLSQAEFAKLVGFSRNAQAIYERDESLPGTAYLLRLSEVGLDVRYVLTGHRTPDVGDISNDELELIKLYRQAPIAVKAAALAALTAGSFASGSVSVSGNSTV